MTPGVEAVTRHLERARGRPLVLLFYDGFERQARAGLAPAAWSRARGLARAVYRHARGKQVDTGFHVAFLALRAALVRVGCEVRVNDFAAARRRPAYPIGLAGYPSVLDRVSLPNPAIFGPGDPGYPDEAAIVARRPVIRRIIQPSDWYVEFYRPWCGGKMMRWPAGFDLDAIADAARADKTVDVTIYDKIRWRRDTLEDAVLGRLIRHLRHRGLSYRVLRYGEHRQREYFAALKQSRALAFLCEHETQGLACQEAMAMNVPVFAWDEGWLADPRQQRFAGPDLAVSSVPYFDDRCGIRFLLAEMEERFDVFWAALNHFSPRAYIAETLGLERSAEAYLAAYDAIAAEPEV